MGVKQGEPLSTLLFIFFVNDMSSYLQTDSLDYLSIDELPIYILLFADDTVLFSYTNPGLQILLHKLHTYCNEWGITVNTDKTVCMVFRKCSSKWFIIVTCAYIYTIIYNYIYKHIKSTRPYGPISHQINKYIN